MAQSITTNIRIPSKLRDQLEAASRRLHRRKNWIIVQALQGYLGNLGQAKLAEEAKHQSLLASRNEPKETEWEENTDTSGWI